ncbi:MAG: hypothetical protein LBP61_09615, partial [Desulfovibrio sp.]|nr:hypothetical protein [Desulfovibrio sp.]
MIRLSEIRQIYPMYSDMTDYELTSALHRKQYSHMPFEEFARQFGGPAAEDPVKIAARSFVAQNPGGGMSPEEAEAAIRAKDRSGPLGFGLNLFEGIRDAVTDELPMSLARVFRAGDIGPGDNSLATRVIQEQERDQAARVPSLQEVQNPGGWNAAAYNAPKSVVTSVAVGVPGALAGGALGGPVGAAAGAGALTYPVFYRMAKDQFVQTVYEAAERELGRPLTLGESNNLKAAIENDANEFGLYEAAPEAVSNVFTAGLFGGAIGKALRGLGLGRAVDAISKRFLTRVGAKFGAEAGEELLTEGVTFQGQEGILHKYGLRDTPPTPGEFLETQGKTVVLGSVLMGGAHSAARGLRGLLQGKSEGDLRREEAEPPQADGSHALPPGGGQAALPPAGGLPALRSTPWIYGRDTAQAPPPPSMLPPAQDQLPAGRGDIVMGMDSTGRGPVSAYGREFQPPSLRTVFMDTGEDVGRNVPAQMEAPPPGAMSLRAMAEPQQTPAPQTAPAPVPPATPAPAATVEPELLAPDEEIPSGIRIVPANSSSVALEGVGDEDPATNRQLEGIGARREEKSGRIRWRLPLSRLPELEKWLEERAGSGVQSDETREAPNVAKQRTAQNGTRGIEQQRGLEPDGRGTRGEPADSLRSRKGLEGGVSGNAQETPSPRRTRIAIPGRDKLDADFEFVEADDIQTSHLPGQGFQKNPRYALENERRYHDEPASRDKVIENASKLDPDLLMDAPDANQGAPVVDREGNVLGGNGRAMSIHRAYDGSPDSAARYRQALERNAARFGLDPDAVKGMKKPMLVRRVSNAMGKGERQSLISALNEGFSYDREKRADSKSRGDRISQRTVKALANGFRGADTLRSYFDEPASAKVVEMLVHDGAIQKTELSAYIGADGLLNPDGKTLIEQALRGRVARNYEILTRLPADILGKIDAAIPHILVAEGIGKPWDITEEVRDAVELLVRFKGSGIKEPGAFLDQFDMTTGRTPRQGVSQEVVDIFRAAISQKKAAFVDMFSRYAGQADVASGRMIPVDQKETFRKTFGEEDGPGREDKMPGPSEVKPDLDNTGDGSVPPPQPAAEYGTPEKPNRTALAEYFRNRFQTGHKFGGIVEARKEASELLKGSVTAGTATAKAVDEAIELGVVLRAREIVREMRGKNAPDIEIYRALVGLHDQQPNLTVRSSTSIAQQAYSTPVPI